nr:hypothetical protein [Thermoleophilaceae bacterium]
MPRAVMALTFFPRGGSSQVTRYLARALPDAGWDVSVACGSLGRSGDPSHAASFFSGIDVCALPFDSAVNAPDPMAADPPFHPSFEDRPGAPDRVFASLGETAYERQVQTWWRHLDAAGAADADVLHLHH